MKGLLLTVSLAIPKVRQIRMQRVHISPLIFVLSFCSLLHSDSPYAIMKKNAPSSPALAAACFHLQVLCVPDMMTAIPIE